MDRNQLASVIITTRNEDKVIKRLILSVKKQSYKKREIVLVDNHSTDKTVQIAKEMGVKVYSFGPERSAQRNYGAKMAKGKYLLFLDADMELSENVISECVDVVQPGKDIGGIAIPEKSKAVYFWEK
ncbi:MAG: glycosyltransferase family A protein, partial [Candidatus Daviesbacteria bacterium]|nr:glycosyltransferase family A protein [Candidatus Daviesbacteria bacterium]